MTREGCVKQDGPSTILNLPPRSSTSSAFGGMGFRTRLIDDRFAQDVSAVEPTAFLSPDSCDADHQWRTVWRQACRCDTRAPCASTVAMRRIRIHYYGSPSPNIHVDHSCAFHPRGNTLDVTTANPK